MRNDFESNYLAHWGLKKGAQKQNHKYVARIGENGKYRYFYTLAEYNAYLKSKAKETKDQAAKKLNEATKKMQDNINNGLKTIDKKLNKKKYDEIKKDLSTEGAKSERRVAAEKKRIDKKNKDLSTISAREKNQVKQKAAKEAKRIAEKEALRKKVERGQQKQKERNAQLAEIKRKQTEKKMNSAIEKKNKEREQWLSEFRKKAVNLFCKDAKDSVKEDYTKHKDIKLKTSVLSKDQDMAAVNRGKRFYATKLQQLFLGDHTHEQYEKLAKGADETNINCASCTIAYDLRRRGYDVIAPKQTTHGFTTDEIMLCYKDKNGNKPKTFTTSSGEHIYPNDYDMDIINARQKGDHSQDSQTRKTLTGSPYYSFEADQAQTIKENMLEKYPEGAYGYLGTNWQGGGGHAQIWSIENGDVVIRDCQWNEIDTLENRLERSVSVEIVRTDNLELNDIAYEYANATELDGAKIIKKRN